MLGLLRDLAVDLVQRDRHLRDGVEQIVEQYLHRQHRQERQDQRCPAIENMFPKFELIAIMMNFMMLPKARRPSVTPRSRTPRSCRSKMMSAASLVTSTALSTEMPTSEVWSDGASLMPSPRKPTTWPRCLNPRMMRFF